MEQRYVPGAGPKIVRPDPVAEEEPAIEADGKLEGEKRHSDRGAGGRSGGRGRSGRGGRGDFNGRHGDSGHREKREFDRHSATGRGREVSRGGRGPGGWGNDAEEALNAEKHRDVEAGVEAVVEGEDPAADGEEAVAAAPAVEVAPRAEVPPEPTVFTLDEYLATRANARANPELFGAVQVRAVDADFSGMRAKGPTSKLEETTASKNAAKAKKDQRSAVKTQIVDLGFKNAALEQQRGGDERSYERRDDRNGGRGGGRDEGRGRGRGEGRGGAGYPPRSSGNNNSGSASTANGVNLLDASAFPSL